MQGLICVLRFAKFKSRIIYPLVINYCSVLDIPVNHYNANVLFHKENFVVFLKYNYFCHIKYSKVTYEYRLKFLFIVQT